MMAKIENVCSVVMCVYYTALRIISMANSLHGATAPRWQQQKTSVCILCYDVCYWFLAAVMIAAVVLGILSSVSVGSICVWYHDHPNNPDYCQTLTYTGAWIIVTLGCIFGFALSGLLIWISDRRI